VPTHARAAARAVPSDLAEDPESVETSFDCSGYRPDAEFALLEKLAQAVAVDEVDRRRAIAGGVVLGVGSE
jgi:hypothetical protein